MIYSSNAQPVVQDAKRAGLEVSKKVFFHVCMAIAFADSDTIVQLETSTPSEITEAYIDAECAPPTATEEDTKAAFSRPARPGRRR